MQFCDELISVKQQRIRLFANMLVSAYLIVILMATMFTMIKMPARFLWGIPVIIVSSLDLYFLTRSFLQKPKSMDTRFSTFIISVGATFGFSVWVMLLSPPQFEFANAEFIQQAGKLLSLFPYPFVVWSLLCLKDCLTVVPEAHSVVAHGPYKYSRHPLYMCYNVWAVANVMMFPSFLMFFAALAQIAFLYIRLRREERILLTSFPEYRSYYETVGLIGRNHR